MFLLKTYSSVSRERFYHAKSTHKFVMQHLQYSVLASAKMYEFLKHKTMRSAQEKIHRHKKSHYSRTMC